MKLNYFLLLFICLLSLQNYAQNKITSDDLSIILGEWTGSLTYIDYRSNQPYTMPADLIIKEGNNSNQLSLLNIYPNEPKANNKDKIKISDNGLRLNNKDITSIQRLSDGKVSIITEYSGKDNKKKAMVRNIYILGKDEFIIRKEVKFENTEDWLTRNEFKYKRKQ